MQNAVDGICRRVSAVAAGFPRAALAFSFMTEQGYEGYAWDWSKNGPLDGTKRLELLEHAGGAPLAVFVARSKTDGHRFDDLVSWSRRGWAFFKKHRLPRLDDAIRERFADVESISSLGREPREDGSRETPARAGRRAGGPGDRCQEQDDGAIRPIPAGGRCRRCPWWSRPSCSASMIRNCFVRA